MLLQGTPFLHRMLLYCRGYHIYCRDTTFTPTARDTTFTVKIPHLLLGYHIYCQDTTFTASARDITSTAGDTTVTAVDTASTAGDTIFTAVIPHLLPGYHIYYHVIYKSMLLLQTCSAAPGYSMLLQVTPLLHRMLHYCMGIPHPLQGIPHIYSSGYHTTTNTFCRRN